MKNQPPVSDHRLAAAVEDLTYYYRKHEAWPSLKCNSP